MVSETDCANITRMGGMAWRVEISSDGCRLVRFLSEPARLGSRGRAMAAVERGKVLVNGEEVTEAGRLLVAGDEVRVWIDRPGSARRRALGRTRPGRLEIVYEDDAVVVVNKPPGMLVVPLRRRKHAESVQDQLVEHLRARGRRRPLVVHRIDRDTSGLVLFALRPDVQAHLRAQFERHEPERVYLAVVHGHPSPRSGTWSDRFIWDRNALMQQQADRRDPRGKAARSDYRVIEVFREASLLEVRLVTGKRNQIRLQASLRGHPLLGERRYVAGQGAVAQIRFLRQALHAHRLAFVHPVSGRRLRFESPMPPDLTKLLADLRGSRPRPGGDAASGSGNLKNRPISR